MKKKVLIWVGVGIVALVIFGIVAKRNTKSHSPAAKASYSNNGLAINMDYCRPSKKGRLIFGEEADKALQPYGGYWRIGANEATTFDVNKDVMVNGKELKAGKYQIYAVPEKDMWKITFNSEWDRWGAMDADHKTDVLTTEVAADNNAPVEEMLLLSFDAPDSTGGTNLLIHWDNTLVKVPVAAK
jgi:hypothetical protein